MPSVLNPLFKVFLSELQQNDEEVIETVAEGYKVWQQLKQTAKRFEDKLSGAACILSEKKQARLFASVLAGFKEHELTYGPSPIWQYRPVDKGSAEFQQWASLHSPAAFDNEPLADRVDRFIGVVEAFNLQWSNEGEYTRWICDYGLSSYDEEVIPNPESDTVALGLSRLIYQETHKRLLASYAKLAGFEKAKEWILGKENRLLARMQQPGQPYRELSVQESWEYHWQISDPLQVTEALGMVTSNGSLAVPASDKASISLRNKGRAPSAPAELRGSTLNDIKRWFDIAGLCGSSQPKEWTVAIAVLTAKGIIIGNPYQLQEWITSEFPAKVSRETLEKKKDSNRADYFKGSDKELFKKLERIIEDNK